MADFYDYYSGWELYYAAIYLEMLPSDWAVGEIKHLPRLPSLLIFYQLTVLAGVCPSFIMATEFLEIARQERVQDPASTSTLTRVDICRAGMAFDVYQKRYKISRRVIAKHTELVQDWVSMKEIICCSGEYVHLEELD